MFDRSQKQAKVDSGVYFIIFMGLTIRNYASVCVFQFVPLSFGKSSYLFPRIKL